MEDHTVTTFNTKEQKRADTLTLQKEARTIKLQQKQQNNYKWTVNEQLYHAFKVREMNKRKRQEDNSDSDSAGKESKSVVTGISGSLGNSSLSAKKKKKGDKKESKDAQQFLLVPERLQKFSE